MEPVRRRYNKQEEARLVTYVKSALEDIYDTENRPDDDAAFVFDVHNERGGSDFENVDLIAFHWRNESVVETITVEAKLEFSGRLVQQANNYRRFSTRAWIAVPCTSDVTEAAAEFREIDPLLFDYVTELGLGILACRKARGKSYQVFPIQWPRPNQADPVSTAAFTERYRQVFEEAQVVERRVFRKFPRVR